MRIKLRWWQTQSPALPTRAMCAALKLKPGVLRHDAKGVVVVPHVGEAGGCNHGAEGVLVGEVADGLHQVLIRGSVAGDHLPHGRDDVERVLRERASQGRGEGGVDGCV